VLPLLKVQIGFGLAERPARLAAELPPEPARTWDLPEHSRIVRHHGMLLVDRMVAPGVEAFEEEQVVVLAELPGSERRASTCR